MFTILPIHFTGLATGTCWFFFCIGIYFLFWILYRAHLKKPNRRRFQEYVNWMLTGISVDTHKSKIPKKCLLKSPNLCMKTNFNHILLNSFLWINATSVFYGLLFQTVLYGALPERNSQPWQAVAWAWVNACKNTAYFFLAFRNRLWRQDWDLPVWLFVIGFLWGFFFILPVMQCSVSSSCPLLKGHH